MYFVYVLRHTDESIYIGYTHNLKRRLAEHNNNRQKSTVRKTGKRSLLYCECYKDKRDAKNREIKLKYHGRGIQEILKRCKYSLES